MRASVLVAAVSGHAALAQTTITADGPLTGALGNATVVENNPPGVAYVATLPPTAFDKAAFPDGGNVRGFVRAESRPDGIGVDFHVSFSNLPATGGPFLYHIHAKSVPPDGNCTAAGGHLDPFARGDKPACDSTLPQTCQVGDLSGKHGLVPAGDSSYNVSYVDLFASTNPDSPAFFGNLSIVMHLASVARLTCANFKLAATNASSTSASPIPTGAMTTASASASRAAPTASIVSVSAAASRAATVIGAGAAAVLAAVVLAL